MPHTHVKTTFVWAVHITASKWVFAAETILQSERLCWYFNTHFYIFLQNQVCFLATDECIIDREES